MEESKRHLTVWIDRGGRDPGAEVETGDITNPHWSDWTGGYQKRLGSYSLFGYISYTMAYELEGVACSGCHEHCAHDAKIRICKPQKGEKYWAGYAYLESLAGPKPESKISKNRKGLPPCTKSILQFLGNGPLKRGELRKQILKMGYEKNTFLSAIRSLAKNKKIVLEGSGNSSNQIVKLSLE